MSRVRPALPVLLAGWIAALLAAPRPVAASDPNQLGLFYDQSATVNEIAIDPNTQQALYLVLLNPVNDDYGGGSSRNVAYVGGFECGVLPAGSDILLSVDFPLAAINVGSSANLIVGYASALPVGSGHAATLATLHVFSFGNNRAGYRLSPASPPSLSGSMAYLDAEDQTDNLVAMMPASGTFEQPVFWFGDWHVRESARWGEVKSLFR
jgi:hypothetical protein